MDARDRVCDQGRFFFQFFFVTSEPGGVYRFSEPHMASKITTITSVLLLSGLCAAAACDTPEALDPGQSLRAQLKFVAVKQVGTSFGAGGHWDDEPDWPFPDVFRIDIIRNSDAVLSATWNASEEPYEVCENFCVEAGMAWSEETGVESKYDFGPHEIVEDEAGNLRFEVEVFAEVAYGCLCQE